MGSVYAVTNIMDTINYEHVNCFRGSGNRGFCGWGVRDRGGDLTLNRSVLCQNWAANPGSTINHIRFRTGAVTGAGTIKFAFWSKAPSAVQYTLVGTVELDGTEFDAGWVADTIYVYTLTTPVRFPNVSGATCLMSVYTPTGNLVQLDYTAATGSADARIYTGDATATTSFDWDSGASVADSQFAVSAEAFDEPDTWEAITDGASMYEENDDWQNAGDCTSPGAGWNNVANIYDGNAGTVSTSVGGNGSVIYIDLGAGQVATDPWARGSSFPDYTVSGVRGVRQISISGDVALNGTIAVAYSDSDSDTIPAAGYENIYWNDTVAAFTDDILIPVIARWLRISQAGTSAADTIKEVEVYQMQYQVADGKFYVEAEEARHYVWLENYPSADKVFKFSVENVCGATSRTSDPITNRRYKD